MRISEVVSEVKRWTSKYDYVGEFTVHSEGGKLLSFPARTTKTRASSMVFRIGLIVDEIAGSREFSVAKILEGPAPQNRAELANWRIEVLFPTTKKKAA